GARHPLGAAGDRAPAAYLAPLPRGAGAPEAALLADDGPDEVRRVLASLLPPEALEGGAAPVAERVTGMLREARAGILRLGPPAAGASALELFVEPRIRPAHLVVCGANAFGQA